jgi:hypothetical protein
MNADKRNRLILLALGTVAVIALVYTLGVTPLKTRIADMKVKLATTQRTLDLEDLKARSATLAVPEAEERATTRARFESTMPEGDIYSSLVAKLEPMARAFGIDDMGIDRPGAALGSVPSGMPFPGLAASLSASGTFWEVGGFLAAFENDYPFLRITQVALGASDSQILVADEDHPGVGFTVRFEGCARENSVFR